ncbi:MAG TPA: hypothetical protein VN783_03965, partial [Thermoanaerobaculia bacterium]|nr:hypothetical protein [Thermoanaerobaculia bacterium]
PRVDPRAATYGFGVPLRPRRGDGGSALEARTGVVAGFLRVAAKREESPIDPTPIPTIPPWVRLPEEDRGRSAADSSDAAHHAGCGCGCGGKR